MFDELFSFSSLADLMVCTILVEGVMRNISVKLFGPMMSGGHL